MADPTLSAPDVGAIVGEIQREVTRRRMAGEYPEELMTRLEVEFRTALEGRPLEELAHIETVRPLESLRPGLGAVVVAAKRLIRRSVAWYVRPITEDQSQFNFAVLRELQRLRARLEALETPWSRSEGAPASEIGAVHAVADLTAARLTLLDAALRDIPAGVVVVVHCTDAALLRGLQQRGLMVETASRDRAVQAPARALGIRVHDADPLTFLEAAAPELAAVVGCGLLPLLPPAALLRLTPLALAALRPGGRLVLDAPDPRSPATPADVTSIDPAMLRFVGVDAAMMLCEAAGFEAVQSLPLGPPDAAGSTSWYGVTATRP